MKTLLSLLVVASTSFVAVTASAAATAYDALNVVRQARGEAILKQLVQVRGGGGEPQPDAWTILMADPTARGGVREFVVSRGQITSERTPLRGVGVAGEPALNFALLNLDSDGAFKLANQQATARRVGFHTVDYTLRSSEQDPAPVWVLQLYDYMGAPVGTMRVSAESGKVLTALRLDPDARQRPPGSAVVDAGPMLPVAPGANRADPDEPEEVEEPEEPTRFGGVFGFVERTARRVGTTTRDVTLGVAGTVQEVLTGERTIDQQAEDRAQD